MLKLIPMVTEKSYVLLEKGIYSFKVPFSVTKLDVKKAVQKTFNVEVKSVKILPVLSKQKISYVTKRRYNTKKEKKVYVRLKGKDSLPKAVFNIKKDK